MSLGTSALTLVVPVAAKATNQLVRLAQEGFDAFLAGPREAKQQAAKELTDSSNLLLNSIQSMARRIRQAVDRAGVRTPFEVEFSGLAEARVEYSGPQAIQVRDAIEGDKQLASDLRQLFKAVQEITPLGLPRLSFTEQSG
jgi:hypothetical protein